MLENLIVIVYLMQMDDNRHNKQKAKTTAKALNELLPGDLDPCTGNKILLIEYSTRDFIICIDSKIGLNWQTSENYTGFPTDFGAVIGNCLMRKP